MTSLFPPLANDAKRILHSLPGLIDRVFPMPGRFRHGLPDDVAELSRLLTSARTERENYYLGKPALLSAYLRYFLPWNIYRLCRLLASLPVELKAGAAVNDLGSGPLTLPAALWISRPDLRSVPLEFRCLDRTPAVLDAGKKFFSALTASADGSKNCLWKIITIRGEVKLNGKLSVQLRGKAGALTTAINIYNELFWNFSPADSEGLEYFAEKQASLLSSITAAPAKDADEKGSILIVEPGIPRSGEFISIIRSCLLNKGFPPISPCTHSNTCPFPGGYAGKGRHQSKTKWCHFAFDTEDAPEELHKLSAASGIPKERAVLSFILAGGHCAGEANAQKNKSKIRVISDSFSLGNANAFGRYSCSDKGMVLLTGSRKALDSSPPGSLEEASLKNCKTDPKSGALMAEKE